MKSGDISKAESANKVLANLIADISRAVKEIWDWRTNLFLIKMNVELWKASALTFLDPNKASLEYIIRLAENMQSSIITNFSVLKRRTNPYAERLPKRKEEKDD